MTAVVASIDLQGYRTTAAPQRSGKLLLCAVESLVDGRAGIAQVVRAADCSAADYQSVRASWLANRKDQPQGSLPQWDFWESSDRLARVVAVPTGTPLSEQIFRHRFSVDDTMQVALSLLECLADWHQRGPIHGRLSAESVLCDPRNRVQLESPVVMALRAPLDLARMDVADVAFCSPEQSGSLKRDIGPAADLYSVGVLLFGMLTGRPPLEATTPSMYLNQQLCAEPARLRAQGVIVGQVLEDIIARLLRRDPQDRYQSASALLHDLKKASHLGHLHTGASAFPIGTQDIRQRLAEANLIGRQRELQELQTYGPAVRDGATGFLSLVGQDTHACRGLLDEVAVRWQQDGLKVLRGGGSESLHPRPLQSLESVIQGLAEHCRQDPHLARQLAAELRMHAEMLGQLFPHLAAQWPRSGIPGGPDAYANQRAQQAIEALFIAFAKLSGGAMFLFDGYERLDPLTHRVLNSLAERIENHELTHLLCVVSRVTPPPHGGTTLPLQPLAAEAMADHLQSTAGQIDQQVQEAVIKAAHGSPTHASAILARLIDCGAVAASPTGWREQRGLREALQEDESIGQLLERQIESLTADAKQTLAAAAVTGRVFNLRMLCHVAEIEHAAALQVATDALRRGLLQREVRTDGFRFAHDQLHAELRQSLAADHRRRLHRRAASYVQTHDCENAIDLAHHYYHADMLQEALRYALAAAKLAREKFDFPIAIEQLEIAKRCTGLGDRQLSLQIAESLGEIYLLVGRYDRADACLQLALVLADQPLQHGRTLQRIGELAFKRGRFDEAARHYEQALVVLGICVPRSAVGMFLGLVWQTFRQSLHSLLPADWVARQGALTATDRLRLELLSQLSRVYWFSRNRLWTLGNHLRSLNEAETFAPSKTLAAFYSEHGPVMSLLRWFGRAHRYLDRSLTIRRQLQDVWGCGQTMHYKSVVLLAECRFEEAIATTEKAVEQLGQTGDLWEMNMARYQGANALYRLGRLEEAVEMAAAMHRSGRQIGDEQATGISLDVWARCAPETLPLEQVADEAARHRADAQSNAQTQLAFAVILLHHERFDEAIDTLNAAIRCTVKAGHLNTYISPCYAWLATALRHRFEATDRRHGRLCRKRWTEAMRAARTALRIARGFPADLPHVYRELAILRATAGWRRRSRRAALASIAAARCTGQPRDELAALRLLVELARQDGQRPSGRADLRRLRELECRFASNDPAAESAAADDSASLSLADRFATVLRSGRQIAHALSTQGVLAETREAAQRLLHGQCVYFLAVQRPQSTTPSDTISIKPHPFSSADPALENHLQRYRSLVQRAVEIDAAACTDAAAARATLGGGCAVAAPIAVRGETTAALLVVHDDLPDLFGEDELRIAGFVTTLAGAALENADGFAKLEQLNATLEQRVHERTQAAEQRARQLAHSNQQLRAIEDQLRQAIAQAHSANQAKSRFLATMSHEIRTPLNGILGMTRLAQQSPADARQADYLDTLEVSGQSLLNLINDLLDFSKLEAGKLVLERIAVDVRALTTETLRLMNASAQQKGVKLVCDVDPEVPRAVLGDPSRLRQVIMNLLGNAIKFTAEGSIRIEVRVEPPESDSPDVSWWTLRVQDTGIGIAEDKQQQVFESFSQADSSTTRQYGGTGLGLAICRELVEMMGGTITLHSRLHHGSTFTVRLPLETAENAAAADDAPPEDEPPPAQPSDKKPSDKKPSDKKPSDKKPSDKKPSDTGSCSPAGTAGLRILVAEDGLINQEVIVGTLEMRGYEVMVAQDGQEAVETVLRTPPDLCLMDVDMPNLDGIQATKAIRRREAETDARRLPIIAMTAHSQEQIAETCLEAGMDDHLSKPLNPDQLFETIERFARHAT
ncbi:hybrid sensor histidine kinase/response regulator [Roseimaritima sediminicola]|uniref:hybrid sensor histidine kinase/response regulator n=1 Tax=Roseimaritima sediminicola TaxID=2662066 RepID=UPI00129832C0|nr:ATP-binding protein [Roseimaritima sediminicola]